MFAIFIICAWSLTLAASTGLLLFGSTSVFVIIMAPKMGKAVLDAPLGKIWLEISSVLKGVSPVYGPTNINGVANLNVENNLVIMIWTGVIFAIAIVLFVLSIMELVRLRKHQKLSKPFVKVIMVVSAIMLLLTFQMLLVIVSALILIAFILLEAILFDSEALNNYAEERNLISIYKEERKFEKEVSKEGKLTGNADLKNQQEDFQKQNDQTKVNDNSVLPNSTEEQLENIYKEGKAKKYYLKWKNYKEKLDLKRKEIETNLELFENKEKDKIISKFNFNVMKVNSLAKKLKIPESYYLGYMTVETQNQVEIKNSNFESTSADKDIELIHESHSEENESSESQTFVAPQTLVHGSKKDESEDSEEEFLKQNLESTVNMDLNQLAESENPDADKNSVYADFEFEQPDLTGQVIIEDMKKSQEKQATISNTAPGKTASITPSFDLNEMESEPVIEEPVSLVPELEYEIELEEELEDEFEEEHELLGSDEQTLESTSETETPKTDESSFNFEDTNYVEPSIPETFKTHEEERLSESHGDIYKKEQVKKEVVMESADIQKLNSIEERMAKLEKLIEGLGSKFGGNQLAQDFTKITNQLDSISKVVNELEHNNPRSITDSLTTRANYNKNNG